MYVPTLPLHESVDVPEPVTFASESEQVRPVDGETLLVRPTIPLNPSRAVTFIVESPAVPTFTVTPVGLAAIAKSCTV